MQTKKYNINENLTLTPNLLKYYVSLFWADVFTQHKDNHFMLMCKVLFNNEIGSSEVKSIGQMRNVNYSDMNAYCEYLVNRLGILTDSYKDTKINQIIFTYFIRDGLAPENAKQLLIDPQYSCKSHSYNNAVLPISMNPIDYGQIDAQTKFDNYIRYVVSNKNFIYYIDIYNDYNIVQMKGSIDLQWKDTKISDNTFKRDIINNTIYFKDGAIVVKEKELKAQPMKTLSADVELINQTTVMAIDIETYLEDNVHKPFLIAGLINKDNYFHEFIKDSSQEAADVMINNFIARLIKFKDVKYVYAHNFSGFDGTFLLKYLINFNNTIFAKNEGLTFKTEPLIFNGRLISIKFKIKKGKQSRVIWFKDSYLMLPLSLRALGLAFNGDHIKTYLPFVNSYEGLLYVGDILDISYWKGIPQDEYNKIYSFFQNRKWSYQTESILYCYKDCKCLLEILNKFNNLVFKEFKVNVHDSLTLPSLAMKIFKAHFMKDNEIFKIVGRVEEDIREAYSGGCLHPS
uniref:Probable DNA polymerase n=1 Tax=Phanerochaete carnosa TaxID=231932 RepID=A0A895KV26_9APHY|nr:DNA polymerase type B [Phanerochaete carnosa]QRZ60387.1 DNA polymerase type B [Phanerochaete carnosa]